MRSRVIKTGTTWTGQLEYTPEQWSIVSASNDEKEAAEKLDEVIRSILLTDQSAEWVIKCGSDRLKMMPFRSHYLGLDWRELYAEERAMKELPEGGVIATGKRRPTDTIPASARCPVVLIEKLKPLQRLVEQGLAVRVYEARVSWPKPSDAVIARSIYGMGVDIIYCYGD